MAATLEQIIAPRERDLGGFTVRRILPYAKRRSVGPFVFLDHMGPSDFAPGQGIDVRPHPHIGLATVTYLFDGEIMHRDSLGSAQAIRPGAVNWMTAGRGIVHSERTGDETRAAGHRLHGLQSWVALPAADEETAPAFHHHGAESLPSWQQDGVDLRLVAGSAYGREAPAKVFSPLLFLEAKLETGATLELPEEHAERAIYLLSGSAMLSNQRLALAQLAVVSEGAAAVQAAEPTHLVVIGGAPLEGPRTIWWNLVSSRPERIEQAKADWKEGRFPPVPGETEFIPLPES